MNEDTFNEFRQLTYEKSGINLGPAKMALVSSRIGRRLRALNLPDAEAYLEFLKYKDHEEEFVHFIDAISTNVTSFFREPDHFEFFSEIISKWLAEGQRRFRFWSAAASTGEEPYSMGMTVLQASRGQQVQAKILATDISTRVLQQCREGVYDEKKLDTVPAALRALYFEKISTGPGAGAYRIGAEVRNILTFARLNLSVTPFPMKGPMDVVFIRNVMIYFDNAVRKRLLDETYRLLKPGGYLLVGHAEGLTGLVSDFKLVKSSVYCK